MSNFNRASQHTNLLQRENNNNAWLQVALQLEIILIGNREAFILIFIYRFQFLVFLKLLAKLLYRFTLIPYKSFTVVEFIFLARVFLYIRVSFWHFADYVPFTSVGYITNELCCYEFSSNRILAGQLPDHLVGADQIEVSNRFTIFNLQYFYPAHQNVIKGRRIVGHILSDDSHLQQVEQTYFSGQTNRSGPRSALSTYRMSSERGSFDVCAR